MSDFSKYVYAMGRGPSKGRNLTQIEACDALTQILNETADPHAAGALLMLMRYRGEIPEEISGFVQALRLNHDGWSDLNVSVDWPSYAAGRTRGLPWFLLAAKLVAQEGYPVFLHGWNSHQNPIASVRDAVDRLGISVCTDPSKAADSLRTDGLVYCPLEVLDSRALTLLKLRDTLGLRSAINTALRGYNPTLAPITLQGVFHPSYRDLQCDAASLLGQETMAVVKGGGGEFEINPSKEIGVFFQHRSDRMNDVAPAQFTSAWRLADVSISEDDLCGLWDGRVENDRAKQIVISTAAVAIQACRFGMSFADARVNAERLWNERQV
jgi:anthranilate phosphoribosyltransferase